MSDDPYTIQKRVAELRVDRVSNRWSAWIVDVHFLDSTDLVNESKNDIVIADGVQHVMDDAEQEVDTIGLVKKTDPVIDPAERERIRKQNEITRNNIAFRLLKDSGDHAFNDHKYIIAYQFYNEAEHITHDPDAGIHKSDLDYLQTMIKETRKNIDISNQTPDQKFLQLMQKALVAKNQRKYDEALDFYNSALTIKPDDEATKAKKRELTTWINNLSRLDAKYMSGQYKDAIHDYEKAIKADPKNSDYYLGRGKCYEKTRDLKKAMNDYKKATELDENNLQAFKLKGGLHEKQHAFADALACFTVCATNDKTDISSFLKMADLNKQIGNVNAALDALDKGMLYNKTVAALPHRKGELLLLSRKLNEALENFSAAITIDSTKGIYYYHRGLCEVDLKKIPEAGDDFANALRWGIDSMACNRIQQIGAGFYSDGLSQYNAGKTASAISLLNDAITIDPAKDRYRFQRGECYYQLKDYEKAIQDYADAININPGYYDAYKQRAMAKFNKSDFNDAIKDYEAAIKINPKIPQVYKYLGDAYLENKDYKNAISNYDATFAIAKSVKSSLDENFLAELYNGRGKAYFCTANYQAALENFNSAVKNNKNIGEIYFNRGKTYLILNELGDAEEDLKKAVTYENKNAQWNFKLGEVYQQRQKFDKAIEYYNMTISTDSFQTLSAWPLYKRATCFVKLNNFAEALKDFKTIQSKNADRGFPDFDTELGNIFLEIDQPDSALLYFNKPGIDSSNVIAIYGKSVAYLQKKQMDEAINWFEKALASGKIPKSTVTKDKRLADLREDKRYKALIRKYY